LFDCGRVTCAPGTTFGNGVALSLGLEGGGRRVPAYAELDVETAAAVALSQGRRDLLEAYVAAVAEYAARAACPRGIIAGGARVQGTPQVRNVYFGSGARVDGATLLADSTLLSSADEPARVESGA